MLDEQTESVVLNEILKGFAILAAWIVTAIALSWWLA